jgi:hypothetical protein
MGIICLPAFWAHSSDVPNYPIEELIYRRTEFPTTGRALFNTKLMFIRIITAGKVRTTYSIHSPEDENMRTRAGHRGDSTSSPNACGKDAMAGKTRLTVLFHEFASRTSLLIGLRPTIPDTYWTGVIVDTGSREVKVSHMGLAN